MEKYTNEELLEVLPPHIRELKSTILSPKQKAVLGQFYILNGLDKKNSEGYFFRSNGDLANDCDIVERTVISAVNKLVRMGFVDTIRGSRKEGASFYRINQKVIDDYGKTKVDDYCKNPIEDCSNDYSKQIAEMTDKIKELEITVKKLVEKNTVIESKNCSTDTDIDKELDKEKEINNNILNKDSLNNIIEETESSKELEIGESEGNHTESQLVLNESLASVPIEKLSQASPTDDSTVTEPLEEETEIPTEEEQYQRWIKSLEPLVNDYPKTSSLTELDILKDKTIQAMREYNNEHQLDNDSLSWRIAGFIAERYSIQRERIETKNQKMAKLFKFQSSQLD